MKTHVFEDAEEDGEGYFKQRAKQMAENDWSNIDTILFQLLFNTYISNMIPKPTVVTGLW